LCSEKKIDVKCSNCGNHLFKKIVTGDSKDKEYGGIEINCRKCGVLNTVGVVKKLEPVIPNNRISFRTKA
jgi:uncharacterized Zn finger protein